MPTPVGPEIPPHLLARRKRKAEEQEQVQNQGQGPETKSQPNGKPQSPPSTKKQRVIGPAPPPAPLSERPSTPPIKDSDESSSDEDDFGPTLSSASSKAPATPAPAPRIEASSTSSKSRERDLWMTMPPTQDDLAARMDPTKIRARGFNTGRGASTSAQKAGQGEAKSIWNESVEQKKARLEREVLGIAEPGGAPTKGRISKSETKEETEEDREKQRRVKEYNQKFRGKTLVEMHGEGKAKEIKEKEDDPSKRGWDYEKDMIGGGKVGYVARREMMEKAKGFGGRFSKGSWL